MQAKREQSGSDDRKERSKQDIIITPDAGTSTHSISSTQTSGKVNTTTSARRWTLFVLRQSCVMYDAITEPAVLRCVPRSSCQSPLKRMFVDQILSFSVRKLILPLWFPEICFLLYVASNCSCILSEGIADWWTHLKSIVLLWYGSGDKLYRFHIVQLFITIRQHVIVESVKQSEQQRETSTILVFWKCYLE